jgi:sugar/nucleoside kinase (ribokinase family)
MGPTKKYDVISICNALVDLVYQATEIELIQFKLSKGHMNLVEKEKQLAILRHFAGRDTTVELGGSSLNAMRALAMLRKKTVFAGMLAHDHYGLVLRKRMEELQIKPILHYTDEDATGTCVVLVTKDGERTMNTHLGASRLYTKDIIPTEELQESRIFHVSGYQWDTEAQKETITLALNLAKEASCEISLDLADPFVVKRNSKDFSRLIEDHADIVFANEEESKLLYGTNVDETAKRIVEAGAIAVIKLGARGALIKSATETVKVDPVPTDLVDTTGAGDMFAAGFLYGYLSHFTLEKSGQIAAYLASDVISRYGAHLSDESVQFILRHHGTGRNPDL